MEMAKKISLDEYYSRVAKEDRAAIKNLKEQRLVNFISSGSWVIDRLIGDGSGKNSRGGIPRGHMTEVYGDESCGKTTLGMSTCVEAQRMGEVPVWLDFERTFSKDYAKKMGLDLSKFIYHEPDYFEHGVTLMANALETHPALIVIDSVAAMVPKEFIDKKEDDGGRIGEHARLMSKFLMTMGKYISQYNVALLFINQLRSVIKSQYVPGPNEETTGGRAPKFYASLRIKMQKGKVDYIKTVSRITGKAEDRPNNINVKVTIAKNKIDIPYFSGPVYIKFGEGFDNITSIIDLADNCGIIRKSGAYYRFDNGDQTLFNVSGRENLRDFLENNQKILELLSSCIKLKIDEKEKSELEAEEAKGETADNAIENLEKKLEKIEKQDEIKSKKNVKSKN